jgi:hypothetical protein
MKKLVFILIAFIAAATFIRAFDHDNAAAATTIEEQRLTIINEG